MEKIVVLGTGNAQALNCFNTCFVIMDGERKLMVDAGGGNGVLMQLRRAGISLMDIHDLIITHAHTDHVTGVIWVLRTIGTAMKSGKYEGDLTIYCHDSVREGVTAMAKFMLPKAIVNFIGTRIRFISVDDGVQAEIIGHKVTFFNILSTKMLQYGFRFGLNDGRALVCLGDEPYNEGCAAYAAGGSWMLSEAFCLYGDRDRYKPYEKHHSTVREACELAERLGVEHLVLWHTEDDHCAERKALYGAEGSAYYHGDLYVPDDLDVIDLI